MPDDVVLDTLTEVAHNGVVPLSSLGTLSFSGPDALTFLQGQITCDLRKLNENNSLVGAYCNRQGRVLAIFHFFYHANTYYAVLPQQRLSGIAAQLKKYILLSKVKIHDVSDEYAALGVIGGSHTEKHLATVASHDIKNFSFSHQASLLWGPREKIHALNLGLTIDTQVAWDLAMISVGFPMILDAQAGHYIPQHIGLDKFGALSFDKGCYIGQEIIARLQYRTTIKKHLYAKIITANLEPQPNDPVVVNGETIGEYINIVPLGEDRYAVLVSLLISSQ